jgi:hypothetical protein
MPRFNWFRFFSAFALSSILFFLISCSEGPAPGPISPINPGVKRLAPKPTSEQSATNTVRPVRRLENGARRALAKSGYNIDKVEQELQAVYDELKAIVDNNPGKAVVDKLNDVLKETNDALAKLSRVPPDDKGALDKIKRAKDRLQDAINKWLLLPTQGAQFMAQFNAVEEQIRDGINQNGDCRGRSKFLWIKRSYGGMVKFGGHSIDVPKYATKQDALFSISISPTDYITVDFGPDGWFEQPVTVTISYKDADLTNIDPSTLTLAWYDESAGQWIDLGGVVDLVNKTVTAKAWHFTQYTISTK